MARSIQDIAPSCREVLFLHGRKRRPAEILAELAAEAAIDARADFYGKGPLIEEFETRVAGLLGKEAAVFMPSGTMAQLIALRIWTSRKSCPRFAMHPFCHLERHEHQAYRELHRLEGILAGDESRVLRLDDLTAIGDPLGALIYELPQRDLGGALPAWEDLAAISSWAREKGAAFHLDGARLWEAQPHYGVSHAEICALFDSVYVSFYKGLAGIAGALLAGPADFVAEARVWQRRQGGNLISLYPYVLSARQGLDRYLPRMPLYRERAIELAGALSRIPGVRIIPDPPHCNFMQVRVEASEQLLEKAVVAFAEKEGVLLVPGFRAADSDGQSVFELVVGEAALAHPTDKIAGWFADLFGSARVGSTEG